MSAAASLPVSLESAIEQLVHGGPLPPKALATAVGKRASYLTDAANERRDELAFQASLIVPLTLAQGNPVVVRFLAHAIGGVLVMLPKPTGHDAQFFEAVAALSHEFADAIDAIATALTDGRIDAKEAARSIQAISELIERAVAVRAQLQAVLAPTGGSR